MLNPVGWSLLGLVSTAWVARRLYGDRAGLLAGALYGVMVGSVVMAVQVRMYGMIATLALWAFWFHRRSARAEGGTGSHLSSLGAEAAVATSHGIGFLMLSGVYAYGPWTSSRYGTFWPWLRWRGLSAIIIAASLLFAWLKRRTTGHPIRPGFADIWSGLQWLVVNPSGVVKAEVWQTEWVLAAAGIWLVWIWLIARGPESRAIAACGVLVPVAAIAMASYVARPVWIPRNLSSGDRCQTSPSACTCQASGNCSCTKRFASGASVVRG